MAPSTRPDTFYCGTHIDAPHTFIGLAGRAWRITLPPVGQRSKPDWDETVGIFIVHIPGAHPFWNHWYVSLAHLRPIDGVRPAHVRVPGATHELNIVVADPTHPLPGLIVDGPDWQPRFLTPVDINEQFTAADDAVGDQVLELAVRALVDGVASPDQDWRRWWRNAVAATAQHYRDGTHSTGGRS